MSRKTKWNDWLWIWSLIYLALGFFNIMFAYLGLICFAAPLLIAVFGKSKAYCNSYCGRGQLFEIIGSRLKMSRNRKTPNWMRSKLWRYGFLTFFMAMFLNMLYVTYLVFAGTKNLSQAVKILWTFRAPWSFAYHGTPFASQWSAQFAFGFYGVMLTSTILGIITMLLFKPRSWCVYCPMGTMTQMICKAQK